MKKCPRCAKYSSDETIRFCLDCGAELFDEKRYKYLQAKPKKRLFKTLINKLTDKK